MWHSTRAGLFISFFLNIGWIKTSVWKRGDFEVATIVRLPRVRMTCLPFAMEPT